MIDIIDMDKLPLRSAIKRLTEDEIVKFYFNMPSKYKDRILIEEDYLSSIKKEEINKVLVTGTISKGLFF